MTLLEFCLVVHATAMVACAVALVAMVLRLGKTVRLLEELTLETRESVRRLDQVGEEVQGFVHTARGDYARVRDTIGDVVGPVRVAGALARGLSAGARAFFRRR